MTADSYGKSYWCIGLSSEKDGKPVEVYVNADSITVNDAGALVAWGKDEEQAVLGFAPDQWRFFYVASVMDGHAAAVTHWPGQVIES